MKVTILGGGAWGTALAATVRRAGADACLWIREAEAADSINRDHENPAFLPGIKLDPALRATTDPAFALDQGDAVILAVPSQFLRATLKHIAPLMALRIPVIMAAKGVELETCLTMREVLAEELPDHPAAILSGPTFAAEVARGLPTAVTLAASDQALAQSLLGFLAAPNFRVYVSDDPIGCEIGGAVKNVLAIACGIVSGRALGDNARAALITRGLAEMVRLAQAKGGKPETLMGLSGLGDLTLTCTSAQSRNCSLGAALGAGQSLAAILAGRRSVAEGVDSAASISQLADRLGIDMPIVGAVNAILHQNASIDDEIRRLLTRPFRAEAGLRAKANAG